MDDGSYSSNFIRNYTETQFELRYGHELSESKIQQASDLVAANFSGDIVDPNNAGALPTIDDVRIFDGGRGVAPTFNGQQEEGLDYTGNISPWSGTLLFPLLGNGVSFRENLLTTDRVVDSGTIK